MSAPDFRLDGKTALVTGASRGIGAAIAATYAKAGANVVLASRSIEGLTGVAEAIKKEGGEATPMACHTGYLEQIQDTVAKTEERYGAIDILVNNAAANPYFGPMVDADERAYDKTMSVNLKGYFFMAQAAARVMIKNQKGGSIIHVASVAGVSPAYFQGIYSMTKAGVISMSKALAKELGAQGIRSNAIAPGLTKTKFASVLIETKEILDVALQNIPLGRYAEPGEMAGAALFLASDASSYVNGTVLCVDGGMMA